MSRKYARPSNARLVAIVVNRATADAQAVGRWNDDVRAGIALMAANLAEEVGVTLPMVERAQARIFGISVARFRESGARMKAIAAAREAQP